MQEEDPAGWEQTWESWISPSPHFCPQLVSFTRLKPTWCNRFGSMDSGQDRTQSVTTISILWQLLSSLICSLLAASQASTGLCHQRTNKALNQLIWFQTAGTCMEPTLMASVGRDRDLIPFRCSGWRLPFVLADPHPVVTQDQLSLSSSSSSGTQTGEMLEAGGNQTTSHCRNLKCGDNQIF